MRACEDLKHSCLITAFGLCVVFLQFKKSFRGARSSGAAAPLVLGFLSQAMMYVSAREEQPVCVCACVCACVCVCVCVCVVGWLVGFPSFLSLLFPPPPPFFVDSHNPLFFSFAGNGFIILRFFLSLYPRAHSSFPPSFDGRAPRQAGRTCTRCSLRPTTLTARAWPLVHGLSLQGHISSAR